MTALDFRAIFECLPEPRLVLTPAFDIVAASDSYLQATNVGTNDLLGRNLFDVFPDKPVDAEAANTDNLRASLERVIATRAVDAGPVQRYEVRQSDGPVQARYWRSLNTPVFGPSGEVACIIHGLEEASGVADVTERMRAKDERLALVRKIEQQARIFDTTLSSITDFAYIFDKDGRFMYVNQALLDLWGLPLEEAVGKNFFDLRYPDALAAKLQRQIQQVFDDGQLLKDETPYTSPTGAGGYYEYIFTPVCAKDGTIEVVAGSTRDITQRRAAEQERERLLAEQGVLQKENAQLLAAERAARLEAERVGHIKDEFLATLSHELRTPLNAILGWAHMLARRADDSNLNEGLRVIERNARSQQRLIEDLLDMSRIVSGKVRLDIQPLDVSTVVEAAILSIRPAADAKDIRLNKVVDTRLRPFAADASRLQQVIWNLLSNAIKFTPIGGKVEVHVKQVRSHVEIHVSDTGSGIEAAFLPHVFERFRQSDASTTRRHSGLGIGLAIVKSLVEMHGGQVRASSEGHGRGSTFVVKLPIAAAQQVESPPSGASNEGLETVGPYPAASLLLGVKVLVVDDEPDGRELVGRILSECGAAITLAASAQEAIDLLERFNSDVLVSDIGMPDVDGYELLRRVRVLGSQRSRPIAAAALTALARPEDRTRALLSGYQTHIGKPVDPTELIAAVATLAGRA
jgi:PAS domain S-box-containing protein